MAIDMDQPVSLLGNIDGGFATLDAAAANFHIIHDAVLAAIRECRLLALRVYLGG